MYANRTKRNGVTYLAIGTEITTGQIHNSNAQWISQELNTLRIPVDFHMTAADCEEDILWMLEQAATQSHVIVVSGGLGPTRDDFTRDVINKWLGDTLEFNASVWGELSEALQSRGIPVAESNRSQCFFPSKATLLRNPIGTAQGFKVEKNGTTILVLPGPPREIQAMWELSVRPELEVLFPERISTTLYRWHCLGQSESRLGEIVEDALSGSHLETGYRPHIPYVEVKVWVPDEKRNSVQRYLERLEKQLSPWLVARDEEDLAKEFLATLEPRSTLSIYDEATGGYVFQRLMEANSGSLTNIRLRYQQEPPPKTDGETSFHISPLSFEGVWEIAFRDKRRTLNLPFKVSPKQLPRARKYVSEASLAALMERL